jgi:adenylyltransferase/sulfurtransferase
VAVVLIAADPGGEGRFSRFSLISWWDQARLGQAKIVVVGAGALGNEVLKNLALLGVGHLAVIDLDVVELSNLSRSVLFRESDLGRPKSSAAAAAVGALHPGSRASAVRGNVGHEVGLGLFRWADLAIGAVDNREARLAINRWCALTGRPWIDGGIEVLSGVARVFLPGEGPCYECTLSEEDWRILDRRRACSLLPREDSAEPRVPTTPTTAAIVAGVQCAEAVKLLHGIEGLAGEGFQFDGRGYDSYRVRYRRDPECYGHETLPPVHAAPLRAAEATVAQVTAEAERRLGPGAEVEACRDLVAGLHCSACNTDTPAAGALGALSSDQARCARCGEGAAPILYRRLSAGFSVPGATLAALGIPPWDILRGRRGDEVIAIELAGDRAAVLEQEI